MRIPTSQLVEKAFLFCQAYSGIKFFPYQEQFSKRIIRSVIDNTGDEITGLQSRQSGKSEVISTTVGGLAILLPVLANMPMFADDQRLQQFKNGILIGVFAPALHQAQISFSRMKQRMSSKSAEEVMNDPDIMVGFDTNNGQNISLTNGSIITCMSASEGSNIEGKSYHIIIVDEAQDVGNFKYSKSISPMGAFYNATKILIGTPTVNKGFFYHSIERNKLAYLEGKARQTHFEYNWEVVVKYNPKYAKYIEGEKARLGEDSDEFQMSYNLKWILERGMFVDPEKFEKLGDTTLEIVPYDHKNVHTVGIDLGKSSDSTVVTIAEVDVENPVLIEQSKDLEVPDYYAYKTKIKNIIELQGDDYNTQYYEIMDILKEYNIMRIVMDATGVGSPMYDRVSANVDCEVIPYVFGTPSKSDLYKHYDAEIRAKRVSFPAGEEFSKTREYTKFLKQHIDLQKTYSGQHMVVSHPAERGAHDDYCDSAALAVFGAKGDFVSKPIVEENPIHQMKKQQTSFYNSRNNITARRRRA
ncbi:putative terminase large subunit [Bacillus phage BCD7]|uniref:Putative terminase large subunit n=1 Tax=Bacillus phage BCD7 TaxID=1136534 RepID=J9PUM4_9CAUD|nr:putative terminase large subunit [Bacillus phage BCD7]AEZ50551.1 putative terminase large subunit [Bacillus phage BCD7]